MPGKHRAHYTGDYATRAARIRGRAYADPTTRCWRCGLTLDEARQQRNRHIKWQAGHLHDGQVDGPLRAEHSDCNASAGASYGNAKREPRSRRWTT